MPVDFDTATIAGSALWAIAFYWGFSPLSDRLISALEGWLGADSPAASLLSVVPFLGFGGLTHYGLTLSLGGSWAVSLGVISAIGCGVYELGRRDGQASE
ncbi:hypothetical protein [Nodosilinea sp. E11]|uniref:hypothetical protein n=1 Tax=Nodosilinea sp. E11 TaxID=3037479 RepID=UPI0029349819|nr:hypothetical protein [Nodosilinea sp. E11]WOD41423.1 hypothetical protein RRF56_11525 [Nodosilinea sp. E11]